MLTHNIVLSVAAAFLLTSGINLAGANGSAGKAKADATTANGPAPKNTGSDDLRRCMEAWDAGTHITRQRWAEICRRQQRASEQSEQSR
jgi:hypothetical protein